MGAIVIDTNLLLDDPAIIFKLAKNYDKVIIPITVLKELDKHKFNPDTSYSARAAIHELLSFKDKHPEQLEFDVCDECIDTNDLQIIQTAIDKKAMLATKDISMSLIAESKKVNTRLFGTIINGIHNPYFYVKADTINGFTYPQGFLDNDYTEVINTLSSVLNTQLNVNAWFFIFITDNMRNVALYANNPLSAELVRIDNITIYRELNSDCSLIKALDWYQICAIYALKEAPSVLITGKWGSGKTLLSTAYAISKNKRKTFIMRPPVGIKRKFDIGFLPGDKDAKLIEWCAGFMSSLYYIYSNTKNQEASEGSTYDYVKDKIFKEKFEPIPINAIQGMSLLDKDVLIADEIQLLDIDTLSMTLSRNNKGSKLIMLGDLAQTYSVVRPSESGLLKLLRMLPHHSLAHVDLKNHYRDDLLEIADLLQDKSI